MCMSLLWPDMMAVLMHMCIENNILSYSLVEIMGMCNKI